MEPGTVPSGVPVYFVLVSKLIAPERCLNEVMLDFYIMTLVLDIQCTLRNVSVIITTEELYLLLPEF